MNTTERKAKLRAKIQKFIERLTEAQKRRESDLICQSLLDTLPHAPLALAAYAPLADEPDIRALLRNFLEAKWRISLPRYSNERVTFHLVQSLDELTTGTHGIDEPSEQSAAYDPTTLALVLVPGRAFDNQGNRLGRGKGGYDRWIAGQRVLNPTTQFWGVAFDEQIVENVPAELHDQRMDAIVTPSGIRRC